MKVLFSFFLILGLVGCNAQKREKSVTATGKPSGKPAQIPAATPTAPGEVKDVQEVKDSQKEPPLSSPQAIMIPPGKGEEPSSQKKETQQVSDSQSTDHSQQDAVIINEALELTYEETLSLFQVMGQFYGENGLAILSPVLPIGLKAQDFLTEVKGNIQKGVEVTVKKQKKTFIEIPLGQVKLQVKEPSKTTWAQGNINYNVLATCVGAECEILSLSIYRIENKKVVENFPGVFKLVEGQYRVAKLRSSQAFDEEYKKREKEAQDPEQAPPQMKVAHLLALNTNKHAENILKELRQQMKQQNLVYSARLFPNLKSKTCDPEFKVESTGVLLENDCQFVDLEKRAPEVFKGVIGVNGGEMASPAGMKLSVKTLKEETHFEKGLGFFLLVYENNKFSSPISGESVRAIQARLCQILVEKGTTFTECEFIPSSIVLDGMALEGFLEGPYYTGDTTKPGTDEVVPAIIKTRSELPRLKKPEATDGT